MRTIELLRDANGNVAGIVGLSDPQDVDGTSATAITTNAINGKGVRIKSIDNALRVAVGPSSESSPLTVPAAGIQISAESEIYLPCNPGDYVAVNGGKANVCTLGV